MFFLTVYSRIRIGFAACGYALTLIDHVVHAPGKPQSDMLKVIARGSQLLSV
jgi:hypothetical protein